MKRQASAWGIFNQRLLANGIDLVISRVLGGFVREEARLSEVGTRK
ncbi:hypothetical protein RE628_12595 [Paenibacillus sp. D2_2]|nr:hypothetical protein [Paenibacillus sp. D2_2]WMT43031.1 hypothetical protein RE628_12595 [Paenibacillus sp. D2_2]